MSGRARSLALVALILISSIAGAAGSVSAQSSVPSGMVAIPDSNVSENLGSSSDVGVTVEQLQGSVMTTDHAESLEVVLTSGDRVTGTDGARLGDPDDLVLRFKDDRNDAGRRVAVPADAVRSAVGYLPRMVHGVNSDGSEWSRRVDASGGLLIFEIPHFSTNSVTFSGSVELTGSPAVSGSQYQYGVSSGGLDAVEKFNVTLTGSRATETESTSAVLADGGTVPLSLAGTTDPVGPSGSGSPKITLTGVETTEQLSKTGTVSDGSSPTVDVDGNVDPRNASVTLTGVKTVGSVTTSSKIGVSDDSTTSISPSGNVAPEGSCSGDPCLTIQGREGLSSASESGTGATDGSSTAIDVAGDDTPQNAEITFTGGSPNTETDTFSVNRGDSQSSNIAGSVSPSSATVDISWSHSDFSHTVTEGGPYLNAIGSGYWAEGESNSFTIDNPPRDPQSISIPLLVDDPTTFDIEIRDGSGGVIASKSVNGWTKSAVTVDLSGAHDVSELTVWGSSSGGMTELVSETTGPPDTLEIQGENPQSVTVSTDAGSTTWSSQGSQSVPLDGDGSADVSLSANGGESVSATVSYTETQESLNPSVSIDGQESGYNGALGDGQSETVSLAELSTGSNSLSFATGSSSSDAPPVPGFDWSINYDETHYTESPSVDVGNDGSTDASVSGTIAPGSSKQVPLSALSSGSQTLAWSTSSVAPLDYDITYEPATLSEDPSVDVDGDGSAEASVSGKLSSGETSTTSISPSKLSPGSHTLSFSTTAGSVDYELSATERFHTEDPDVDVDGDGQYEITHSGTLSPGDTTTSSASIPLSTSEISVGTNAGSSVEVNATYSEVTETRDPAVEINGHVADISGTLADGETASVPVNSSWIVEGTNRVNVSVSTGVSADAPTGRVGLDYRHDAVDQQSVDYQGETWSERYNVSKTWADSRQSADLTVPFAGNVVAVRGVELRRNGSSWSSVDSSKTSLDGTTLTVDLGSVAAMETTELRVIGSKVRVGNGEIQVIEPTVEGNTLETGFTVEQRSTGFYIDVSGTASSHYAHRVINASWSSPGWFSEHTADGSQYVYLPEAPTGGSATVSTLPLEIEPETGDVNVDVERGGASPKLVVSEGSTPGDSVTYRWHDTTTGEEYALYSESAGLVRDQGTAQSPVELVDDDSGEVLIIREAQTSSSSSDGGGGSVVPAPIETSGGGPLESVPLVILIAAGAVVGAFLVLRRYTDSRMLALGGTAGVGILVLVVVGESFKPGVLLDPLGENLGQIAPVLALIFGVLLAYYLYRRFIKGAGPRPIQVVSRRRK